MFPGTSHDPLFLTKRTCRAEMSNNNQSTTTSLGLGSPVLAFDVGGTDIKAVLLGPSGDWMGLRRVPTPHDGPTTAQAVVERTHKLGMELTAEFPDVAPQAVGLLVPGLVNAKNGMGIYSANLGWSNFPFLRAAEEAFGLPIAFDHDVTAASLAEMKLGAGQGFNDAVVIVVGTGIAGTIFSNGSPVAAGGYAGELGHTQVPNPDRTGTVILESVGSAGAIVRRYEGLSGHSVAGAAAVLDLSRAGDEFARRVWVEAVDALAFTMAQCVTITGAEAFIVGGGLSEAGEELLAPLRRRVGERLTFHRQPDIVQAQLGQDAGLFGAALGARALLRGT